MDFRIDHHEPDLDGIDVTWSDDEAPPRPPEDPPPGGGGPSERRRPMTDDAFLGTGPMLAGLFVLSGFGGIAVAILLAGNSAGPVGAGLLGGSFVALYVVALNLGARWFYRHR